MVKSKLIASKNKETLQGSRTSMLPDTRTKVTTLQDRERMRRVVAS